jgi:lysozyme family protein
LVVQGFIGSMVKLHHYQTTEVMARRFWPAYTSSQMAADVEFAVSRSQKPS